MKSKLTNVSGNPISLFAMVDGVESKFEISPGEELVVDDYETKTIKIFMRKGLIAMEHIIVDQKTGNSNLKYNPANLIQEDIYMGLRKENKTIDETIDPNNDEPMDHFHTTETHEVKSEVLEVVEGEVKQYVENGYIKGAWTDEDIEYLKKNYPKKGRTYCSTHLNRNESSVQKKINSLKLKKKKKK